MKIVLKLADENSPPKRLDSQLSIDVLREEENISDPKSPFDTQ